MSLMRFLLGDKPKTAPLAKERLQIILTHERSARGSATPDYLPALRTELIAVIKKYVRVEDSDIQIHHQGNLDVLEVKIDLPDTRSNGHARPADAPPA